MESPFPALRLLDSLCACAAVSVVEKASSVSDFLNMEMAAAPTPKNVVKTEMQQIKQETLMHR